MMASEFVKAVMERFVADRALSIEAAMDAELREMRDVLTLLKSARHGCWCDSAFEQHAHSSACQRARQLAERLRIT
jgi:hypothetical protein